MPTDRYQFQKVTIPRSVRLSSYIMRQALFAAGLALLLLLAGHVASFGQARRLKANGTSDSTQSRRQALVIGNRAYASGPLRNPVNDAAAMAAFLHKQAGFDVTLLTDVNQRQMDDALREFGKRLKQADVGLFYFSGHGVQSGGSSYLIPLGHRIEKEEDIRFEAVDVGRVLAEMGAAGNSLNLVILDACRDNPFVRGFRSAEHGLGKVDAPAGVMIAYATAPGKTADDNASGENGLYTAELLKQMGRPGLAVEQVFKEVRREVQTQSHRAQIPWEESSLTGDFVFVERGQPAPGPNGGTVKVLETNARLEIKSDPAGAKIWIDGKDSGQTTPASLDLDLTTSARKDLQVQLQFAGYKPLTLAVTLERGKVTTIEQTLKKMIVTDAISPSPGSTKNPNTGLGGFAMTPNIAAKIKAWRQWMENHKQTVAIGHRLEGVYYIDKDIQTQLTKQQAQRVLTILKTWRNKPVMTEDQARDVNRQLGAILNEVQFKKIATMPISGSSGSGGGRPTIEIPDPPTGSFNPLNPDTVPIIRMRPVVKKRIDDFMTALEARVALH